MFPLLSHWADSKIAKGNNRQNEVAENRAV